MASPATASSTMAGPAPAGSRRPEPVPGQRVDLRSRVFGALADFVTEQVAELERLDPDLAPLGRAATDLVLADGKRLRPAFCYWGWRGARGADGGPDRAAGRLDADDSAVAAAASLELLHACALVHDDVMDNSDTRRGRPAAHRTMAAAHRAAGWRGDAGVFGRSGAVLLGDLLLVWADQMLAGCGLPADAVGRAWPAYSRMRTELVAGQYLDLAGQASGAADVNRSLRVARYKSATYTVQRPLHVGGLLAGADPGLLAAYTAYGLPLGEAFQLRDDVLGVFGDPAVTGKPAGDDLREGKRTTLVALAYTRAEPAAAAVLDRALAGAGYRSAQGNRGIDDARDVLVSCGALAAVEDLIAERTRDALAALDAAPLDRATRRALTDLAVAATVRRR